MIAEVKDVEINDDSDGSDDGPSAVSFEKIGLEELDLELSEELRKPEQHFY